MEETQNISNQNTGQANDMNRNPSGKGGFGDHPENINRLGGSLTQNYITYWYKVFLDMPISELLKWEKEHPDHPTAAALAYAGVVEARTRIKSRIEVTDRTEGKAVQKVKLDADVDINIVSNKELADRFEKIIQEEMNDVKPQSGETNTGTNTE